jgi:hypothetical protein
MLPKSYSTDYAAQDFASRATVARGILKRGALALGGLVSDRTLEQGRGYNRVLGTDFSWQRSDTERLTGQLLLSATTAQPDATGALNAGPRTTGHAASTSYSRENDDYAVWGQVEQVTAGFRDDNGFISQAGEHMWGTELTRKFGHRGIFSDVNLYLHAERKFDTRGQVIYNDYTPGVWMAGPHDTQLNFRIRPFNASRVSENGPLLAQHTVWGRIDSSPGPVLARLSAELELGDEIDVESDRRGKGGTVYLYARLRPHDRVELEPTFIAVWIDGRSGPEQGHRLYTEQALQLNGIVHLSAQDSVRMILQASRTTRNPVFYALPVPARSTGRTSSFVYAHTASLGKAAYVGLTLTDGETPGVDPRRRQDELFVKLSWQI